ncbi:MAG: spore gernimation protein GerD [Bacillaceae bacterium]|nr:spore gernimation protein GerD [Bacillaceae bacterium]
MKSWMKLLICTLVLFLPACAAMEEQSSQPDYESTKKMMIDMLKTDEGKKAIQEVINDDEVRQELIMEQAFVKDTIQQTLTSEHGKQFWQELMQEPEFAKSFAESMQQENEKLLKSLMKDPEYQDMMIDILQDPEMEKAVLDLLKSKEHRQQVMNIMADAFESPFFKARVNEILGKVASEQMEKEAKEQEQGNGE